MGATKRQDGIRSKKKDNQEDKMERAFLVREHESSVSFYHLLKKDWMDGCHKRALIV